MTTKEILVVVLFLVLIPALVFFGLHRSKLASRIVLTVVAVILGAIAVPNFIRPRVDVSQNACVNNLQWIQKAKQHWAMVNHKKPTDIPTMSDLFNPTNDVPFNVNPPSCPAGGTYTVGAVDEDAKCSIGPPQHTLHPQKTIIENK